MGIKVIVDNVLNLLIPSSATKINNNTNKIADEFDKVVYRDGSFDMRGTLDMNGNRVINSGFPVDDNDLATYAQVKAITRGDIGPSGGNVMSVGLFTEISTGSYVAPVGTSTIQTSGHTVAGIGGATYVKSATNPLMPGAGSFQGAGGQWWKMVIPGGICFIEQFGGRGDAVTTSIGGGNKLTTGTDNYGPLNDAINSLTLIASRPGNGNPVWRSGPTIMYGVGSYYHSQLVEVYKTISIVGQSTGHGLSGSPQGTVWTYPAASSAIRFHNSNTNGSGVATGANSSSAQGSSIEGIAFYCLGATPTVAGNTDLTKHCIIPRTRVTIRRCSGFNVPGDFIYINATSGSGGATEGNANNCVIQECLAFSVGGDGLSFRGNDANACQVTGFETFYVCGSAILESSGLGNGYVHLNIAGYGNDATGGFMRGVTYGGRRYALISPATGVGGTTTPGTNESVWYSLDTGAANLEFPAWVSGGSYRTRSPIIAVGASNRSKFTGNIYVEGAAAPAHVSSPSEIDGGQLFCTDRSNWSNANTALFDVVAFRANPLGSGSLKTYFPGTPGYALYGANTYSITGGGDGIINRYGRTADSAGLGFPDWRTEHDGPDVVHRFGSTPVWRITGPSTTVKFGRTTNVPYAIAHQKLAIVDPTDGSNNRLIQMSAGPPSTTGRAQGEVALNVTPSAGGVGSWTTLSDGTQAPTSIVGAIQAAGLTSTSTAAEIVAALKTAGLAS